jgi:cobalt-zinc-cadmium efflux system protein
MIIAAGVALAVDGATVLFLYGMRRGSLNLRAGFLHKLSDALASVGVIVGGVVIVLWHLSVVDLIVTVSIAAYILWQGVSLIGTAVSILMESVPGDIDVEQLQANLKDVQGVRDVHHLHVWQIDEDLRALEAHILIGHEDTGRMEHIKRSIKNRLREQFGIAHSTLEFELCNGACAESTHDHPART